MSESGITLTLELRPAAGGVSGTLTARDGSPQRFEGWLELISALEGHRGRIESELAEVQPGPVMDPPPAP